MQSSDSPTPFPNPPPTDLTPDLLVAWSQTPEGIAYFTAVNEQLMKDLAGKTPGVVSLNINTDNSDTQ